MAGSKLGRVAADSGAAIMGAARHVLPQRKEARSCSSSGDLVQGASPRGPPGNAGTSGEPWEML